MLIAHRPHGPLIFGLWRRLNYVVISAAPMGPLSSIDTLPLRPLCAMYTGPWPRAASPLGVPNLLDGKRALPIPTTPKPIHYLWGPTPFLGACGGLAPSCYPGPLSFSHRRIRALGTHDHIYALPLGPLAPCTQAHGPALLDLWGPLTYLTISAPRPSRRRRNL